MTERPAAPGTGRFPVQLTSFVGRADELADLRRLASQHRLVTLTGPGGVGKTRLAQRLAGELSDEFGDAAWWVDLASTTDPHLIADRVEHTLELPDQPGRSAEETLLRFLADRESLIVVDNCEHLLDGCATLLTELLTSCPGLRVLATSREPIGVVGEATWATPPLSLTDEAVQLFTQRARLVRPDFAGTGDAAVVAEICRRLDGLPLAIELAATRVRALSLTEISEGLRQRLELLTGGARTAAPRQQTLRASVDWSHDLLLEPERVIFRRLSVFAGGFDLDAAHAVAGDAALPRHQTVDTLTQLVDKSLVVADNTGDATRYRMLETVRHYALEKLDEAAETTAAVRTAHRDHYTALFGTRVSTGYRWHIEHAEIELDNLRAAFTWSREHDEAELATRLSSSLLPLWIHNRPTEGLAWFDTVLTDGATVAPAVRARALADRIILAALSGSYDHVDHARQAEAIARDLNEPALLAWTLAAHGSTRCYQPEVALPYFAEAIELSPALNDDWRLSQVLGVQAYSAYVAGDLATLLEAAEKGRELARSVGDWSMKRLCDLCIGLAWIMRGELIQAAALGHEMAAEGAAAQDLWLSAKGLLIQAEARARQGDTGGALAAAEAGVQAATDLVDFHRAFNLGALVDALLADGDVPGALAASEEARDAYALPQLLAINGDPIGRAALASGDVSTARQWANTALSAASGAHRMILLENSVRVAIAEGHIERAEREAHEALAIAAETTASASVPEVIECLAELTTGSGRYPDAARMLGSAAAIRKRTGTVRFKVYDADCLATAGRLREAMAQNDFENSWAEGAALSTAAAIAHAQRDRNESGRPTDGWAALTRAERGVARLVAEGLRSKDIATKLFISARTVDSHLARIYRKLGINSRVQLAREAARHD